MRRSRLAALAVIGVLVAAFAPAATARPAPGSPAVEKAQTTEIQILGLNDFHGQLEPVPSTSSGGRIGATPAGGVEYLATHVRDLRATNPNTLFVSAGDLIGATPLISALFHDEPTIEAFNLMALDYNGVGNHEFDEGVDELLRMQNGGCHPVDGCLDGDPFHGADFQFLAANVAYKDTGETIFPPYAIHHFPGVKIAIVGMTLEGTPSIVTPAGISHVNFFDEADSVNALVPHLRQQGIETIIVLLHEGGSVTGGLNETTINQCNSPSGALPPIVERMDDAIDVVITGHTNWAVNCIIDGKVVTGAAATGRLITDIDLTINRATKNPVQILVNNKIVTQTVPKAPDLTALVTKYKTLSAPLANRVVGNITADITRTQNAAGESSLGNLIADSQYLATKDAGFGEAVVAFMNPGGIRADLTYPSSPAGEGDGVVTYGEIFTVQPFGNSLVTMTLTGAQIDTLLEQQFDNPVVGQRRMLQISDTLRYSWSASAPTGSKVDVASIMIGGVPINPAASYRVTVNSFLADGGDLFSVLSLGTNRLGGDVDLDAVEKYFNAQVGPVAPPAQNRITMLP
ncbi:MAG TPA: bifunctional metallophosphatase/5'-nucleotidase [Candidatus Limnocylindrales bacterium]|nr:bifunctional metallophosphatase/5'-nucleotidase [Candidatus Limnocylindrales bacterium]